MSGIVGMYRLDGAPVDPAALRAAHARLAHRGPHGGGCWHEGPVGLGHQLLRTTPEAGLAPQPLRDAEADLVLTADARIDNRNDLIRALGLRRPAEAVSDAQLILGAYRKWSTRCPEHLIGAFAFVLWDGREQRLFGARDHMGLKPFYYAYQPTSLFACGSEIKALLALDEVPREVDEAHVASYLEGVLSDQESTFYRGIQRLTPAHAFTVSNEGKHQWEYWALDPDKEVHFNSDEEYARRFREIFAEAVRCRLRSTTPVGTSLSGGLDSSSVTCMARDLLREQGELPLHSFSAVFPNLPEPALRVADERHYMHEVIGQGGIIHHPIEADKLSPLDNIHDALHRHDQPFEMRNVYIDSALCDRAQSCGVRVMLTGLEGDLAVSHGYGRLGALAGSGNWYQFVRETREVLQKTGFNADAVLEQYGFPHLAELARSRQWLETLRGFRHLAGISDKSKIQIIKTHILKPSFPESVVHLYKWLLGKGTELNGPTSLLSDALDHRVDADRPETQLNEATPRPETEREDHYQALIGGYISTGTEIFNKNAAVYSIDVRHPFYDKRVVEFCLSLPANQKLRNGWNRFVLRQAMKGTIPEKIRQRAGKGDLSPNFLLKLHKDESEPVKLLLQKTNRELASFVDLSFANTLRQQGKLDRLWPAIVLGFWLSSKS